MSQLTQDWIPPVVQLPASDPQVEAQPRRVRVHVARPVHLVVAVRLTGAPPAGKTNEETNSSHLKQRCKIETFPGRDIPDLSWVWNLLWTFSSCESWIRAPWWWVPTVLDTHHSLSVPMASSSSCPSSCACLLVLTRRSQSSSCSCGRGWLYRGCLNSASTFGRPFVSCAAFPPPMDFFSFLLKGSSAAGRWPWTFIWCCSASTGLGRESCCTGTVSRVEEEEEDGGRMHAVWRMERQKKARSRWMVRDRQAKLR